ncbi:hypothetical protein SLS58_000246 [Diplodia intermedia]|uniref:Uncharacterized protein n=1 Tax=Diplodia intermedia TaxID=856260 RepID=A0ABR3U5H7_9PEZI
MEATSPRSPSQASPYGHGYDQDSYAQSSTYPSPARTEGDSSSYMADSMVLYNHYPSMALSNHSVHPAQTLYPLSPPHPTEAPWTPSLATTASPSMTDGQRSRVWAETYETVPVWDQPFTYAPSGSLVGARHSPALSDGALLSQRSSIASYVHSPYSQDESDCSWVKAEPQNELVSDEDPMLSNQPLTVSPQRLGNASEDGTVNTSTGQTGAESDLDPQAEDTGEASASPSSA